MEIGSTRQPSGHENDEGDKVKITQNNHGDISFGPTMIKSIHSDFLIHWTGDDIDKDYDKGWWDKNETKINTSIIDPYLKRLKYILKYGLWMNRERDFIKFKKEIKIPAVARTCFTELKLSETRIHAIKFGRLGIGFKRMFVFDRMGFPMIYFRPEKENWLLSPILSDASKKEIKEFWACFLKSMDEELIPGQFLKYKQFDESEWRIIYSNRIKEKLRSMGKIDICRLFKKPNDIPDSSFHDYVKENDKRKRLEYLIPLEDSRIEKCSRWFAMIIYPSLAVKVASEADEEIRSEILRLKPLALRVDMEASYTSASCEKYSKPIEIDLAACRNF
jgi:hypothetical protein